MTNQPQAFTDEEFAQLQLYKDTKDRESYYSLLESKGYSYGTLALGVVRDNTLYGKTANNYAGHMKVPGPHTKFSFKRLLFSFTLFM